MRIPRRYAAPPHSTVHKIWRCHNREFLLEKHSEKRAYLEALRKYPTYFYAGAAGPGGFPELVAGPTVLQPDSTGIWVEHIIEAAWTVQSDPTYTPEEKLQTLAWAYGFSLHAAGDAWSHTLVNDLVGGDWPDVNAALLDSAAAANLLRHLLIENYVADATPGFDGITDVDGDLQRTTLPDGDVSDDSTPMRELDVPWRFIYETLIVDLPDLPDATETLEFSHTPPDPSTFDPGDLSSWEPVFESQGLSLVPASELDDIELRYLRTAEITPLPSGDWLIRCEYTYYRVEAAGGGYDIYLMKMDADGNREWTRTYGNEYNDFGLSIAHTEDDGYIIAGYTALSGMMYYDIYILKIDADGDTI